MVRKSDVVRDLVSKQNYKAALRIAKDFKLGISREQSSAMTKAYECMVHERFYLSLGEDIGKRVDEGIEILISLYGRKGNEDAKIVHKQI